MNHRSVIYRDIYELKMNKNNRNSDHQEEINDHLLKKLSQTE